MSARRENPLATNRNPLAGRMLAFIGILLVAATLRTAVAAISPIVASISVDVPISSVALGVLGMLPPVCFALSGVFAPVLARVLGIERTMVLAVVVMTAGHLIRALAPDSSIIVAGSIAAFAGMGIGNVLLPPIVKRYFPDRIGLVSSSYVTIISVSTFVPPLVAAPVAHSAGWRVSLGMWAVVCVAALGPWVALAFRARRNRSGAGETGVVAEAEPAILTRLWRSPVAWAIAVTFSISSLNAYALFAWLPTLLSETAGVDQATGGALLSLYALMGFPCALIVPALAVRLKNVSALLYLGAACFVLGDLGLLLAPGTATWLWVVLAGLGPILFPVALVLINLRSRSHTSAVALSGFVQGIGYTIGAGGPLVVGLLHEWTGSWNAPLWFLLVTALGAVGSGFFLRSPRTIEDDLSHVDGDHL